MAEEEIRQFRKKKEVKDRPECARAYQIVEYGHESCHALHEAFKKQRGGKRGAASDEEQDVLRAILISAGACLDSSLKQLFKDSIRLLIMSDEQVGESFEKFVAKALARGSGELEIDTRLLAKALVTPLPIMHLAEKYLEDLTGSSLQSADQVFSAGNALGIDPCKVLKLNKKELTPVFEARNKIVHEFDIDFSGARRNRVQRKAKDIVSMSNELLLLSQKFVEHVFEKLPERVDET